MLSAEQLVESTVDLVSLPAVYLRAKERIDDPDSSLDEVAEVIGQDPAMTARLLRIANSAFFGFAARIETVGRAVNILGTQQVHDLLLATSVSNAFSGISSEVISMDLFWRNSVHCGVAARLLASRCNVLDSERLFVEGLLRDIGHLVMYTKVPGLAKEALVQSENEGTELVRVERELMGFDYAVVGAELMRVWRLPDSLQESVRFHPEPAKAQKFPLETAIVHIAAHMTTGAESKQPAEVWVPTVSADACYVTGLSEEALPPILEEARTHTAETVKLIFPENPHAASG